MLQGLLTVTVGYLGMFLEKKLFCKKEDFKMARSALIGIGAVMWLIMLIACFLDLFSGKKEDMLSSLIGFGILFAIAAVVFYFSRKAHRKEAAKRTEQTIEQNIEVSNTGLNSKSMDKENTSVPEKAASSEGNTQSEEVLSTADELRMFKELLDDGIITQEEFDAKKKQLLGL